MSATSSQKLNRFKSELLAFKQFHAARLSRDDQHHLQRWLDEADDPCWGAIADDAHTVVGIALGYRRLAEKTCARDESGRSVDPVYLESKKEYDALCAAAEATRILADYYSSRRAPVDLPFWIVMRRDLGMGMKELVEFHKKQEQALRFMTPFVHRHHVSRQSGGKGKRARSREYNYFCTLMVDLMREFVGQPHYTLVAEMTNIAFDIEDTYAAEDVKNACKAIGSHTGR